MTSHLSV